VHPASPSPRVTVALAHLRERGERLTPARLAVLRVIDAADNADEHLTAEEVGARVAQLEPTVHRATVYRTLTSLSDAGVLFHVHLGGTATVYHLAEPHPAPEEAVEPEVGTADYGHLHPDHAHVQCVVCGRVLDVPPEALEGVAARLRDELGFTLDTSHAALLGRCRECS
jgi:Fur family ferric uptake transcriptional regulator